MAEYKLGEIEKQFAELIWSKEPVSSGELVKLAEQQLNWKKSTTYTVLRRLCQRGIFQNSGGTVTALVSREEFDSFQSKKFVEETFCGSLPAFFAAFTKRKNISPEELAQIRRLIDSYEEG